MEVNFYCSSISERNYVGEFIKDLPVKAIKKIMRQLELIEKYGINFFTRSGTVKKLHGYNLYEIIIDFNNVCYRIFCVIRNAVCWLLHMFIKKSYNTPQKEINTALRRGKALDSTLLCVN